MIGFSPTVRQIIYRREDGWCARCGLARGTQAHHRRVKGMGGTLRTESHLPSAGLWLCEPCHRAVHHDPDVSKENGWLVSQWTNPAEVSVLYRGVWVRLDDRGNLSEVENTDIGLQ